MLHVYVQRLICWFRIGFGRLEFDVKRDIAKISKLHVYVQRLICWFRIGLGRLEFDVKRDIAKISKTKLERESGELF